MEGTRGIAQAERHPPIGKSAEGAGECGLFLILRSNSDLHITRKTIKETVVRFTCQAFKHLVNEWQGKMVLFGNLVQLEYETTNIKNGLFPLIQKPFSCPRL